MRLHAAGPGSKEAVRRLASVQIPAPVPVQAAAPPLKAPQPQAVNPDVLPTPNPAPALPHPAAAVSAHPQAQAPLQAQAEPRSHPAALPSAPTLPEFRKTAVVPLKQAAVFKPAQIAPAVPVPAGPRNAPTPAGHPELRQVASRHSPAPEQAPAQLVPAQTAPAPSAAPPAQSAEEAVTLPAGSGGYDPEADARRRKSAWSQEGASSRP